MLFRRLNWEQEAEEYGFLQRNLLESGLLRTRMRNDSRRVRHEGLKTNLMAYKRQRECKTKREEV